MFRLEWLFLLQFATGILMIVFLQKISRLKKQVDEITKEVKDYLAFITAEEEELQQQEAVSINPPGKVIEKQKKIPKRKQTKEEAENSLIQAVLGEYFP